MDSPKKTSKNKNDPEERPKLVKCPADLQRLRIEKLMKNPDKPVNIPERPRDRNMTNAPDFVRNVMGSSAGAGSGEFHVYRHLRRKEYARQKFIQEKSRKEILDEEYHNRIENNKKLAADKTAKKREKRLKRKLNIKLKGKRPKIEKTEPESNENSDDDSETDDPKIDDNVSESQTSENPNSESHILENPNSESQVPENPELESRVPENPNSESQVPENPEIGSQVPENPNSESQ